MATSRSRRTALAIILGGLFALSVGGAIGAIGGDPPRKTSTTTVPPTSSTTLPQAEGLGKVGKELDELVEAGRHVDHHALYLVDDSDLPEGMVQTVEIWRKADQFRSDIIERNGAGTHRQSSIQGGSYTRSCETVDGEETCKSGVKVAPDLPAYFVTQLLEAKDPKVTARDDDVAGYVARCFEAKDGKKDLGELCLALDGVMLRLKFEGATVEATSVEDDVPASAFDNSG